MVKNGGPPLFTPYGCQIILLQLQWQCMNKQNPDVVITNIVADPFLKP